MSLRINLVKQLLISFHRVHRFTRYLVTIVVTDNRRQICIRNLQCICKYIRGIRANLIYRNIWIEWIVFSINYHLNRLSSRRYTYFSWELVEVLVHWITSNKYSLILSNFNSCHIEQITPSQWTLEKWAFCSIFLFQILFHGHTSITIEAHSRLLFLSFKRNLNDSESIRHTMDKSIQFSLNNLI